MMADEDRSDEEENLDLFNEPAGYYEPEKEHTFVEHTTLNGQSLSLRLVGHNPLWVGQRSSHNHFDICIISSSMSWSFRES